MPSLRAFVARVPADLMRQLLGRLKIVLGEGSEELEGVDLVAAIEAALTAAPGGTRGRLEAQIEKVDKLANETGEVAIRSFTVEDELLDTLPSRHARSLWMLLNEPNGFRRAEDAFYSDTRRMGPQWTAFALEKNKRLSLDEAARDALIAALRQAYDTPNVEIDVFERNRAAFAAEDDAAETSDGDDDDDAAASSGTARLVQVTIYCEDKPNEDLAFKDGRLGTQMRYPVIEAAVTYEPATGAIECVARRKDKRAEVVRLVATTLFGASPDFEPARMRAYDLSVLAEQPAFDTDPDDGIESVHVTMMRLLPAGITYERIIVENPADAERDIWAVVEERLGQTALTSDYFIGQARIVIRYRAPDSGRVRSLPITITHPHHSNLRERLEIERVVANKYLARWGLIAA